MGDVLVKKRRRRAGYRGHLSKLEKDITECINSFDETNINHVSRLNALKNNFNEQIKNIKTLDNEIFDLLEEDEIETEIENSLTENDKYFDILSRIDAHLNKVPPSTSSSQSSASSLSIPPSSHSDTSEVNLPKINLPFFDGNPLNWQSYWDQFQASVDLKTNIQKVVKFNYLTGSLSETVSKCISGLTLTNENYDVAVKILKERYANPQMLISSHMEALVKLNPVKHKNDVKGLRKIYDQVESSIRNLNSLNVDQESYGTLLVHLLNEKLPSEIRLIIARRFGEEVWTLKVMLEIIKTELFAKERCVALSSSDNEKIKQKRDSLSTTSCFHNKDSKTFSCVFCKLNNHSHNKCDKVTDKAIRKNILKKEGRCFLCLQKGHVIKDCKMNYSCNKCSKRHHISICEDTPIENPPVLDPNAPAFTTNNLCKNSNFVLLKTATTKIVNPNDNSSSPVRVLLDGGSQRSYILNSLKSKLNLPVVRTENLIIEVFMNEGESFVTKVDIVKLKVFCKMINDYIFIEAISVPNICSPLKNQNISYVHKNYAHLQHLTNLADYSSGDNELSIQVLIGMDYYYSFITDKIIRGAQGEPVGISSKLGWILCGEYEIFRLNRSVVNFNSAHVLRVSAERDIRDTLQNFYEIESLGVKENEWEETDPFIEKFENNLRFNGKRYVTRLPFKDNNEFLPDNYEHSKQRLLSLKNKLDKDKNLLTDYNNILKDHESEEIIEKVTDIPSPGKTFYLPHLPVIKPERTTTKMRIVFDASAKTKDNISLNDCLYSGPCLLPLIFDILLRFRTGEVVLVADIKKAFLNIEIDERDRDYLRFLWFDDIFKTDPKIVVYRILRVIFGLTCSPFLLGGTIKCHLWKYVLANIDVDIILNFLKNLYVDDVNSTFDSCESGFNFYLKMKRYMMEAGFELRKWESNDKFLREKIRNSEGVETICSSGDLADCIGSSKKLGRVEVGNGVFRKVLGVSWDPEGDDFVFNFDSVIKLANTLPYTKRNILKIQASFYDPLGQLSPITLQSKLLFKLICIDKSDWDTLINSDFSKKFKNFIDSLIKMKAIRIPRYICVFPKNEILSIELHGFADSSLNAFAAVIYLRVITRSETSVKLICSKSKVSPMKKLTIPRLELLSCVLLSKLVNSTTNALKDEFVIDCIYCWSDSQIALHWIKNIKKEWKLWVNNRVMKIRSLTKPDYWKYVSSKDNPADLATREILPSVIVNNNLWWSGPQFLNSLSEDWPEDIFLENVNEEEKISSNKVHNLLNTSESFINFSSIVDIEKFSSLKKLLMVTKYVLLFIDKLKKSISKPSLFNCDSLSDVENLLLKDVQRDIISHKNYNQWKISLNLFTDSDGVIRSKSRLSNGKLIDDNVMKPILLLPTSYFTKLVVWRAHEEVLHAGTDITLNRIRNKYWILSGRQTVRKLIKPCVICKRFQGKPPLPPPSPALPDYRVCSEYPFQSTGFDFAGPLLVRDIYSRDNDMFKCYILVLTCATTRGVHLELCSDMSASTFINGFKRFIHRKGIPSRVVSDNFQTFKSTEITTFFKHFEITWEPILELSPWWGGFYERLNRIIKSSLRKVIGNAKLKFDELNTLLIEVESMLNSRPLTYLSEENYDVAITPYHMMFGRNILNNCYVNKDLNVDITKKDVNNRVKYMEVVLQHFWNRFYVEYTTALRERTLYNKTKTSDQCLLSENDVVLIKEDKMVPRTQWKKGKIEKLLYGKDGHVRGARLKLYNSKRNNFTFVNRPIQKVIPLEIYKNKPVVNNYEKHIEVETENSQPEVVTKSRREAAKTGELKRKLNEFL